MNKGLENLRLNEMEVDKLSVIQKAIFIPVFFSVLAELLIFFVFGVFLFPEGSLISKFLWTVLFCGVGMGATNGAFIIFFLIDKYDGYKAILATTVFSLISLGIGCNLLCLKLDQKFHFFGGSEYSEVFIVNGVIMSVLGGLLSGILLFTDFGRQKLRKVGL